MNCLEAARENVVAVLATNVVCWLLVGAMVVVAVGIVWSLLAVLLSPRGDPDVDP